VNVYIKGLFQDELRKLAFHKDAANSEALWKSYKMVNMVNSRNPDSETDILDPKDPTQRHKFSIPRVLKVQEHIAKNIKEEKRPRHQNLRIK
jgi:hypothetical protein